MSREPEHQPDQEPEHLQHAAEHEKPGKANHVMNYLVILFAAAFLLMLLSYFMQQRTNQEAMEDLKQSVTTMTSVQDLIAENNALEQQVKELEEQRKQLETDLEAERTDPVRADTEWRAEVLTQYAILEQAMRDKDYEIATQTVRGLCEGQSARDLDLGIASQEGPGSFSLVTRLEEIIAQLTRLNYLEADEIVLK